MRPRFIPSRSTVCRIVSVVMIYAMVVAGLAAAFISLVAQVRSL